MNLELNLNILKWIKDKMMNVDEIELNWKEMNLVEVLLGEWGWRWWTRCLEGLDGLPPVALSDSRKSWCSIVHQNAVSSICLKEDNDEQDFQLSECVFRNVCLASCGIGHSFLFFGSYWSGFCLGGILGEWFHDDWIWWSLTRPYSRYFWNISIEKNSHEKEMNFE